MISFFPTQSQQPKQPKLNPQSDNKIKVDFHKFQTFYYNLIDDPIRPQIEDFFLLQDKVDVQEKFNKYDEQQKIIKQTYNTDFFTSNDDLTDTQEKKNIIFRPPFQILNKSQNRIPEKNNTSRITYFEINSSLRNGINNKTVFKRSFETKREDKQNIEKLRTFLYEQQAVFFLLKGNIQLHKKIDQVNESQKNDTTKSRQLIESILECSNTNIQTKNKEIVLGALGNMFSGFGQSESFKGEEVQTFETKVQKKTWRRFQQIKENFFFSLINFKSLHNSHDLQYYKFIPKSDCMIAKIAINHSLGSTYIKKQQQKLRALSSALLNTSNNDNSTKSQTFKELFDTFQEEFFKREMNITAQGRMNERIYVLQGDSQVEFTKRVHFKQNQNIQGNKNIKISSLRGPILINAQIFLDSSKIVLNLLKSNSFHKKTFYQDTQNLESEDEQTKSHSRNNSHLIRHSEAQTELQKIDEAKQVEGLEKKLMIHKKRPSHSKKSSLFDQNKIYFGRNQKSYFQFFLPQCNTSSFTIKSTSAYATVYSISLEKFVELTPERMKKKIAKSYEEFYVTCLRKSMQRLNIFEKQVQISCQKKNAQLNQYAALVSIQKLNRLTPELKNQVNNIDVSPTKVQFHSRKQFKGLKRNDLVYKQGQVLEKKMELIQDKRKDKQVKEALAKNFKKKIQNLIVQNLKEINLLKTDKIVDQQKELPINQINKFYAENLTQILNSQKLNLNSSQRHTLLDRQKASYLTQRNQQSNESKKQTIIEKEMYVDPDSFDPKKNRSLKISFLRKGHPCVKENQNFLRGLPIDEYTDSIKSHVSVKINETNKIKEQFIKIQSKCQSCKCYDDLESYRNLSSYNSQRHRPCSESHRQSSHDIKYHTMKIGVNWKTNYSSLGKVESKTVYNEKGVQKKLTEMAQDDEPFEKVYNRIRVLKQKSLEKFNFNEHLQRRVLDVKVRRARKKSAPLLI